MSQSSSGAPGWQLEGNAPLAYDTHIVDVFLQDYSRRLEICFGTSPSQAPKSRPLENASAVPIAATIAQPQDGIVTVARQILEQA